MSIWKKWDKHTSCTSHSLHHNSSARLPQLPLFIIDEISSVGLICHGAGCIRPRAAAAVVEGDQLMPHEEKWNKGRGTLTAYWQDATQRARSVAGLLPA